MNEKNERSPYSRNIEASQSHSPRVMNHMMASNHGQCTCEPAFIQFTNIHCVSHQECPNNLTCDLCRISTENKHIQSHLKSEKHRKHHKQFMEFVFLYNMPLPTGQQLEKLTELIEEVARTSRLSQSGLYKRMQIESELNDLLSTRISKNVTVRIYGSTISGFALKYSDINLELTVNEPDSPVTESAATVLSDVSNMLDNLKKTQSGYRYSCVWNEFNLKSPKVHFREDSSRSECELTLFGDRSWKTSTLLGHYAAFDPRVPILGIALRKWAEIYGFDKQEDGTWPAHIFPIMVIHFLQRCNPAVLPCFHECHPKYSQRTKQRKSSTSCSENPDKLSKEKEKKRREDEEEEEDFDFTEIVSKLKENWRSENRQSVGELWLNMFRYYSVILNLETDVVSIRHTGKPETHKTKKWGSKVLAIEDPCRPSLNLSRSVAGMKIYNTFLNQLRNSYSYFAIPFIQENGRDRRSGGGRALFSDRDFSAVSDVEYYKRSNVEDLITRLHYIDLDINGGEESKSGGESESDSDSDSNNDGNDGNKDSEDIFSRVKGLLKQYGVRLKLDEAIVKLISTTMKDDLVHTFDLRKTSFFQRPSKFCRLCHKYGHSQKKCPDEILPELHRLPEMTPIQIGIINGLFKEIYFTYKLDEQEERLHASLIQELSSYIRKTYPQAQLELFGSTKNQFGAKGCDVDICLTFENNIDGKDLKDGEIIEKVAEQLKQHPYITQVLPITSAKVPIVKFVFFLASKHFECDISLYNILAKHNTRLLATYCKIDDRVAILGLIVKHFFKKCDICDASRGSLSSYAYTLMVLHYLQQRGVIPNLQAIGLEYKVERIVDTWDTWFYEDLKTLKHVWNRPYVSSSIAELFVDFLKYYSEEFKFDEHVVSCRRIAPVTRLEKMWTGRKIAIEDPFNLNHNLGAGVDDQMGVFIKSAIIKGRNHFGNPFNCITVNPPHGYYRWQDFYFDKKSLTQGMLPTGRGCRFCGKIGHKISQCPEKKQRRQNFRPKRIQSKGQAMRHDRR